MSRPLRFIRKEYRTTIAGRDLIAPTSGIYLNIASRDASRRSLREAVGRLAINRPSASAQTVRVPSPASSLDFGQAIFD